MITEFIRPVCLPLYDKRLASAYNNVTMFTTGWHEIPQNGDSNIKLKMEVSGDPISKCAVAYEQSNFSDVHQVCAGRLLDGPLACECNLYIYYLIY